MNSFKQTFYYWLQIEICVISNKFFVLMVIRDSSVPIPKCNTKKIKTGSNMNSSGFENSFKIKCLLSWAIFD